MSVPSSIIMRCWNGNMDLHKTLLWDSNKPRIKWIIFSFDQHNPANPRLNKLPEISEELVLL